MSVREAKAWAKENRGRDWRDKWRYGRVVRAMGLKDGIVIEWGPDATPLQKQLIQDCITNISVWGEKVEEILDNPPDNNMRNILRELKRLKVR